MTFAAFVAVIAGAAASAWTQDWSHFPRGGAVMVLFGVVLGGRIFVRKGLDTVIRSQFYKDYGLVTDEPGEGPGDEEIKLDVRATYRGGRLAVAGTLIWAFGDLVGRVAQ